LLEADQENPLLVSDLILSRRIIFSASEQYVNMYVNFVNVKSWINVNRNWGQTKVKRRQPRDELKSKAAFRP